ncbi:SDR family NAD(P)-dependent oxidoreductase [Ornithinimicrobium panacihumi]|uniref:SDR family NAD(P)-dependent oxidoreductase n=1 Tax=Ornithinimicrobium panacihumi TaxID=2008449 RepID=UPI003F88E4B9
MSTVLITGASSGIGHRVAELLAPHHRVVGAARRLDRLPAGVEPLALDLADSASIAAAAEDLLARVGRVDVLINCAGYGEFAPVELTSPESVARQLQVNLVGLADLTARVLPGMRAAGAGRIVMVSSVAAAFSSPMGAWYHAGKAALEAVTDALRVEVAPFGIQVAVVQPGPVRTDWHERALGELVSRTAGTPYARMGEEVAAYHAKAAETPLMSEVDDVARAVVRAATETSPRTHYPVGRGSRMAMLMGRIVPKKTFDAMTRKQFGLGTRG